MAEARGVPTKTLSILFIFLLAITVAEAIQVVGVLLVFALIVAPAAAAQHLTRRPFSAIAIAIALGVAFTWGGLLLALATSWPVSFYYCHTCGAYIFYRRENCAFRATARAGSA